MKKINVYPDYYREFRCIADKCPDSCCEQWEIVVDKASEEMYQNVSGDIGEKLRNSIETDEDGDRVFRLCDGRCPFFEKSGLCEIHRTLGEEFLCGTCREYPRAVQDCGDYAEYDLSLSCPAAAEIILSREFESAYITEETEVPFEETEYEVSFFEFMKNARRVMLDIIWDKENTPFSAVQKCLAYALCIQDMSDEGRISALPCDDEILHYSSISLNGSISTDELFQGYLDGEILTAEFRDMTEYALSDSEEPYEKDSDFSSLYRQLCTHYINRYWLRAVFDGECADKIFIMAEAFLAVQRYISAYAQKNSSCSFSDALRIVQLFCKETEHLTE